MFVIFVFVFNFRPSHKIVFISSKHKLHGTVNQNTSVKRNRICLFADDTNILYAEKI